MYRKILVGGVTAAAIIGAGGAALALSGSNGTEGTQVTTTSTDQSGLRPLGELRRLRRDARLLRHVAHGEVVINGQDGYVTHDFVAGMVTSVSSSSITIRSGDGTSETYAVTKDTRVRVLGDRARGLSSIGDIATGDHVGVAGTGTSTLTAKHVIKLAH
ncbi:MAG TPA: hypothetical protein VE442_12775 [Jatrophihabitans sp.]|jgi:hypothetical protein|nr:hypothetical protein [Jatrophihabitans sp.]